MIKKQKILSLNIISKPSNDPHFNASLEGVTPNLVHVSMRMYAVWKHIKCDIFIGNKELFNYLQSLKMSE